MTKRPKRTYTEEFKKQMVLLYQNGKPRKDILAEYELTAAAFNKWGCQAQISGSFKKKDNRTPEQEEMIRLHSSLDYQTPVGYRFSAEVSFKKSQSGWLANH